MENPDKAFLQGIVDQIEGHRPESWILMVPNSIAETAIICGLSKSFAEKHGHSISLVIRDIHNDIAKMYPDRFGAVFNLPMQIMRSFSSSGFIHPNQFELNVPFNTWLEQVCDGRLGALQVLFVEGRGLKGGLTLIELYRYVLRLDWDAKFERPVHEFSLSESLKAVMHRHGLNKENSVLIFPGNNSNIPPPQIFWENLVKFYADKGKKVLVNTHGAWLLPEGLALNNVIPVQLEVVDAINLINLVGEVVMSSNGLLQLSLLLDLPTVFNVIMTDKVFMEERGYIDIQIHRCSNHFVIPEILQQNERALLNEWTLPSSLSDGDIIQLASDVVGRNKESANSFTPPKGGREYTDLA